MTCIFKLFRGSSFTQPCVSGHAASKHTKTVVNARTFLCRQPSMQQLRPSSMLHGTVGRLGKAEVAADSFG